jgi:hypothetical protein
MHDTVKRHAATQALRKKMAQQHSRRTGQPCVWVNGQLYYAKTRTDSEYQPVLEKGGKPVLAPEPKEVA